MPRVAGHRGLPAPIICDYLSREASRSRYAPGTEFQIGKIEMVANTGTYVDSPFHRYPDGKDLSALPLTSLANLDCVVARIPATGERAIDNLGLTERDVRGKAVLVQTGWDRHWRTDAYYEGHPFLTATAARYLAHAGVKLVGIDSHNIDDTKRRTRPVHTILLGAGVPICEHLCNLGVLPSNQFRFTAVPPKVSVVTPLNVAPPKKALSARLRRTFSSRGSGTSTGTSVTSWRIVATSQANRAARITRTIAGRTIRPYTYGMAAGSTHWPCLSGHAARNPA